MDQPDHALASPMREAAPPAGGVPGQIERLHAEIDQLEATVAELTKRIDPVVRHGPISENDIDPTDDGDQPELRSELADRIATGNLRLRLLGRRVVDLMHSVDL